MLSLFGSQYSVKDYESLFASISTALDKMLEECDTKDAKAGMLCMVCDHKEACADLFRFERYLSSKIKGA